MTGNERGASALIRQAAKLIDDEEESAQCGSLIVFATEVFHNSCQSCGRNLHPKDDRAYELKHEKGCPAATTDPNWVERSNNYTDQLGEPGASG